jgi:hypothetical protein
LHEFVAGWIVLQQACCDSDATLETLWRKALLPVSAQFSETGYPRHFQSLEMLCRLLGSDPLWDMSSDRDFLTRNADFLQPHDAESIRLRKSLLRTWDSLPDRERATSLRQLDSKIFATFAAHCEVEE